MVVFQVNKYIGSVDVCCLHFVAAHLAKGPDLLKVIPDEAKAVKPRLGQAAPLHLPQLLCYGLTCALMVESESCLKSALSSSRGTNRSNRKVASLTVY